MQAEPTGDSPLEGKANEVADELNWVLERLSLSPEEEAKFRQETVKRMQDAIAEGFRRGEEKARRWHEWRESHPGASAAEEREFRLTIEPEDVAWEDWQEANPLASREDAAEAYEGIYGFEPDAEDVEEFEPDPFLGGD